LQLKRAYEPAKPNDGICVLVDYLRGVSKAETRIGEWMKEIARSAELRKWSGHEPTRWTEFQRSDRSELRQHGGALARLRALARTQTVTLVYSAHDEQHNDAVVLRDVLLEEGAE
jgi:uncharacterized protein YeaO (DUF488 family)